MSKQAKSLASATWFLLGATFSLGMIFMLENRSHQAPALDARKSSPSGMPEQQDRGSLSSHHSPSVQPDDACQAERARVQRLRSYREELERREGQTKDIPPVGRWDPRCTPIKWPENVPEKYHEEALHAVLTAQFRDQEFEIDCSEFPCIVALEDGGSNSEGSIRDLKNKIFSDARSIELRWGGSGSEGPRSVYFFSVFPPDSGSNDLMERVEGRLDAKQREFAREAGAALGAPAEEW